MNCVPDCSECPADAENTVFCGNGTCDADETCTSCAGDCGPCVQLPTLPADGMCSIAANGPYAVNVRKWPSTESDVIAQLDYEQTYTAISLSLDTQWFQLADTGWVASWIVRSDGDCTNLPSMAFDTTDPAAALEVALVAHPTTKASLDVLTKCNLTADDLGGMTVPMVLDVLTSMEPCITFERAKLVLAHPEYDSYWANLYGGPFGQDIGPNPMLVSVTGVGQGRVAAEAQCPELWQWLESNQGQISLLHLYHMFSEEWDGAGAIDPTTGAAVDGICAAILNFQNTGGVPAHMPGAARFNQERSMPSCSVAVPADEFPQNITGITHQDWPFFFFGGRNSGHYEAPYLLQSDSWSQKVLGLDRTGSIVCQNLPELACDPFPMPVITSPPDNTTTSGLPTIAWEHNDACIPDGFEVLVVEQSLSPNSDPAVSATLPSTARSWTVPSQLHCDTWYTVGVIAVVEANQSSAGAQQSFLVGPNNNCQPPPTESNDPNDPDQPGDGNPTDPGSDDPGTNDPASPDGSIPAGGYGEAMQESTSFADAIGGIIDILLGGSIPGSSNTGTGGNPVSGDPPAENMTDVDGDGVWDDDDACPGIAGSADWYGCPSVAPEVVDPDGDGVEYPFDLCWYDPGPEENNGCPPPGADTTIDTDGDGIVDVIDDCPNDPGLNNGCPLVILVEYVAGIDEMVYDSDSDGWVDGIDECPYIPGYSDNNGCPIIIYLWDYDGDGVFDGFDECPAQPGYFDLAGCPKINLIDADRDGINNLDDACPYTHGDVDNNGCPPGMSSEDRDQDGVPDNQDICLTVPGNDPATGCPGISEYDNDGDGVLNAEDECLELPGYIELRGCPDISLVDTDQDTVLNSDDLCPDTPGAVDNEGCPYNTSTADSDQDGVPDTQDYCPTVVGNDPVTGCPTPSIDDSDGDGVLNAEDDCPATWGLPAQNGCTLPGDADSDLDQVPDNLDLCPTVYGNTSFGCPAPGPDNQDGDNHLDIEDPCPDVPGGYDDGCPQLPADGATDGDSDGVYDYADYCPTIYGTDANGCPPGGALPFDGTPDDIDGDGIPNEADPCLGFADATLGWGCGMGDDDLDGYPNGIDACPQEWGQMPYSDCYLPDTDGDTMPDAYDMCPTTPGERYGGYKGCNYRPDDTDNDFVPDELDLCPLTEGYTQTGCPWNLGESETEDADGDGLSNYWDPCPTIPGSAEEGYDCPGTEPPDYDDDGVPDFYDVCPGTPGTELNGGCPVP